MTPSMVHYSPVDMGSGPPRDMQPYSDATYRYYCYAVPGTLIADENWLVLRETIATGVLRHATPAGYCHAATSLAVVEALTYTA